MRILVVDDEIDTLGLIELTLQTAGYDVKTVPCGEEALKQLRAGGFDAVLLDEMMPDKTGSDVLRILREEKVAVPPVIFLTAKSRPEDRAMGASLR